MLTVQKARGESTVANLGHGYLHARCCATTSVHGPGCAEARGDSTVAVLEQGCGHARVGMPVAERRHLPMVLTVQKTVEVPKLQFIDMLVVVQQQVPMVVTSGTHRATCVEARGDSTGAVLG